MARLLLTGATTIRRATSARLALDTFNIGASCCWLRIIYGRRNAAVMFRKGKAPRVVAFVYARLIGRRAARTALKKLRAVGSDRCHGEAVQATTAIRVTAIRVV
jgi:hypothetical protein